MTTQKEVKTFTDAWEAKRDEIGRGIAPAGTKTRAGLDAVFKLHKPISQKELTKRIHELNLFNFDYCQHGTYSGGPSNGEPYAMCDRFARALLNLFHIEEK